MGNTTIDTQDRLEEWGARDVSGETRCETAMFLTGLIAQRDVPLREMLDRYELYVSKHGFASTCPGS